MSICGTYGAAARVWRQSVTKHVSFMPEMKSTYLKTPRCIYTCTYLKRERVGDEGGGGQRADRREAAGEDDDGDGACSQTGRALSGAC